MNKRQESNRKVTVSPTILQQIANAPWGRSGGAAQVHKIEALGRWADTKADRGQQTNQIIVRVLDEQGNPLEGVGIVFRVIDPDATGTGFIAEGIPSPLESTFCETFEGGLAIIMEPLRLGLNPGRVIIRAAELNGNDGVYADFRIEISKQTPTRIELVSGGNQAFPSGDVHFVEAVVRVLDEKGDPVSYGEVAFGVPEDDPTGSFLVFAGFPAIHYSKCNEIGEAGLAAPLWVGTGAPGAFHIVAKRVGAPVSVDIPYLAVPLS
ncbi:Ig-like domain-containing protein [Luteibacter anthropi]|uniref:Ig-like domain-containing protein n=1 Tax=Luteibacter anthropi TaxID=564369 RepID=UPI0020330F45|nr:Ig-like domain-containing protein [Luteibacter anthropi]URX62181.1 Ig-like domain-containing protein [Luteibacter anthropi]